MLVAIRAVSWIGLQIPRTNEGLDDLLYMRLAAGWYWGYEYDHLAFVRRPGFPLWIAFWNFLGIPFAFAQKSAYIGSFVLLAVAARRVGVNGLLALAALALCLFHPFAAGVILRMTPDGFYTIVSVLALAFAGFAISAKTARSRLVYALLLGVSVALVVLTRDEQIVAFGWMAVLGAVFVRLRFRSENPIRLMQTLVPFCAGYASLIAPTLIMNAQHFGVFAISEFSSKGFSSAYRAALSVPQEKVVKGVPVTMKGFEQLFEHCPAWAELETSIRRSAPTWSKLTESYTGDPEEVGAGAFPWMLKNAVNRAGYYSDAKTADAFYRRLSREIRAAQERGAIGKRGPVISQLDPEWKARIPDALDSLSRQLRGAVYPSGLVVPFDKGQGEGAEERARFFHELLGRSMEEPPFYLDRATLEGWVFKANDEVILLEIVGPGGESLYRFEAFHARPDVQRVHAISNPQLNSGFRGKLAFDSLDTREAKVVFHTLGDATASISLAQFLESRVGRVSEGLDSQIVYYLDTLETEGRGGGRLVPSSRASSRYAYGFAAFVALGVVLAATGRFPVRRAPEAVLWALLVVSWFAGRFALNVVVDATAFPCVPRNAFAAWVLMPFAVVALSTVLPSRGTARGEGRRFAPPIGQAQDRRCGEATD